ncbi:alpha/beta hydrolase [Pseudofulvibacter geojedonensis]|uniref:Alpha/beta hydrolase n=1 Tax=Pseudofulvibacter geojedonensis TaxID=1123758 RepID=A0ABW3I0H6_9FLAO
MKNIIILFTALFSVISFAQDIIAQDLRVSDYVEGTLLLPNNKTKTVAIIIPGSGPTDRDGNQNFLQSNSLKYLAQDISNAGIATFRYDKRALTMLKKGASEKSINAVRFDDFVEDAKKTVQYLKRRGYEKIYFIGHSQGSLVAMLASHKDVTGFISIAGAGRTIDEVIMEQLAMMLVPKEMMEKAQKTIDIMKTGKTDKDFPPALANVFNLPLQPFMINWMKYSPTEEIKKLTIPTLIINGTKDFQVSTNEAALLKNAQPDAEYEIIENMNHALKTVESDDKQENAKTYNMPQLKNTEGLAQIIIDFIKK